MKTMTEPFKDKQALRKSAQVLNREDFAERNLKENTRILKQNVKKLVWEETQMERSANATITSKPQKEKISLDDTFFRK